jgi:hypothetical protein
MHLCCYKAKGRNLETRRTFRFFPIGFRGSGITYNNAVTLCINMCSNKSVFNWTCSCQLHKTRRSPDNGATRLSITTLSIKTLSITTLSIMTLSITTLSITTLSLTKFSITTLSIKASYVILSISDSQQK